MTVLDHPPGLTPEQTQVWDSTCDRLTQTGATIDPNSLHAYVSAVTTWRRGAALLAASDILTNRDGRPLPNPALDVMRTAATTINEFASRFRLNHPGPRNTMSPGQDGNHHEPGPLPCPKCNTIHDRRRCDGHSNQHRGQCGNSRGHGTDHLGYGNCKHHGGASRGGTISAGKERDLATQQQAASGLLKLASRGEVIPLVDPLSALADMAAERIAWKDELIAQVNDLGALVGEDPAGAERVRELVKLAERMADRAYEGAAEMAKLHIDERLVAVQRRALDDLVDRFDDAMRAILAELGHDLGAPEVVAAMDRHLKLAG